MNTKYSNSNIRNRRSIRLKGYDYRLPGAYFITLVSWQRECSFSEVVDGRIQLNSIGKIIQKEWRQLVHHFPQIRLDAFVVMPNHVHGIIVIETVEADHLSFVWANRPSADEIRDNNDILVDQMKENLDGLPQQGVRATRPSADEIRDTNDILVYQMKDNLDGSPRQGPPPQTRRPIGPRTNSLGAMIGQFKSLATKRIWALAEINRRLIWQRNYYEHIIRNDLEYRRIIQYIETNPLQWHDDPLHPSLPGILEGINHGR